MWNNRYVLQDKKSFRDTKKSFSFCITQLGKGYKRCLQYCLLLSIVKREYVVENGLRGKRPISRVEELLIRAMQQYLIFFFFV